MSTPEVEDDYSIIDRFRYWFFTKNSTRTGVLWILISGLFFLAAGAIAIEMRIELMSPELVTHTPEEYGQLFSVHGTFMIFFFAVPIFFGFASAILPQALGTDNLAFPRMNNMDLWLIMAGGLTLEMGHLLGQSPIGGWTGYPPLTTAPFQPGYGTDLWMWAVFLETLGTLMAAVNILATLIRKRSPRIPFLKMPIFAWTMLFTALLVIVAAPFLLTALSLLFLDRNLGTDFYSMVSATQLLLWQDLFWFYSHPATYVMLLPVFGIVTLIIARFSGRPIFSYVGIVVGTAGVWLFSYLIWWHHMFATGMHLGPRIFASVNTWGVSVFSGVVVFIWLASMWRAKLRLTVPMLWCLGIIATFTIGGADGVYLALVPLDVYLHDTWWLVSHFHYIIFGSTVLGTIAAIYYWFPAVMHRKLNEKAGLWHFWLTLIGINLTFFPMHNLGLHGLQRRIWTYPAEFTGTNVLIGVGTLLTAAAQLVFIGNIIHTLLKGREVDDDVWGKTHLGLAGPGAADAEPVATQPSSQKKEDAS